jgi:hypothetical protein
MIVAYTLIGKKKKGGKDDDPRKDDDSDKLSRVYSPLKRACWFSIQKDN